MQRGKGQGASLRAAGAYLTLFSFVGGGVVLFAFPGSPYVSAALLIILALTFIGGLITLVLGLFFGWRGRRALGRTLAPPPVLAGRILRG